MHSKQIVILNYDTLSPTFIPFLENHPAGTSKAATQLGVGDDTGLSLKGVSEDIPTITPS